MVKRVDVAPVVLGLRMDERVAVDLGRGCEQEPRALALREAQGVVGAQGADLQRLDGVAQVVHRAGRRGEVQDVVHLALDVYVMGHVVLVEAEVGAAEQVGDVVGRARQHVVNGDDFMAPSQERVAQV